VRHIVPQLGVFVLTTWVWEEGTVSARVAKIIAALTPGRLDVARRHSSHFLVEGSAHARGGFGLRVQRPAKEAVVEAALQHHVRVVAIAVVAIVVVDAFLHHMTAVVVIALVEAAWHHYVRVVEAIPQERVDLAFAVRVVEAEAIRGVGVLVEVGGRGLPRDVLLRAWECLPRHVLLRA